MRSRMELTRASSGDAAGVALGGARRGRVPAHALLPIQHWQTTSGARVFFVESRDLPMLDLSASNFPAGAAIDTRENSGARRHDNARAAARRGRLSEDEICAAHRRRRRAACGALRQRSRGARRCARLSTKERSQALDIFAASCQPEFPRAVLEREKVRVDRPLKEADTRPETIAARNFYRLVYRDHPYCAARLRARSATVQQITRERSRRISTGATTSRSMRWSRSSATCRARRPKRIAEQVTRDLPRSSGEPPCCRRCRRSTHRRPRHRASRLAEPHHDWRAGHHPRRSRLLSRSSSATTCSAAAVSFRASTRKCGRSADSRIPRTAISRRCSSRGRF